MYTPPPGSPGSLLLVIVEFVTTTDPASRPPPSPELPWLAELWSIVDRVTVACPSASMPPPPLRAVFDVTVESTRDTVPGVPSDSVSLAPPLPPLAWLPVNVDPVALNDPANTPPPPQVELLFEIVEVVMVTASLARIAPPRHT